MPTGPRPAPPTGTARIVVSGTLMGHKWVNVYYLNLTHGVVTVTDLQSIADGIEALYAAQLQAVMPTSMVLNLVDVSFIPTSGSVLEYSGTYNLVGTNTDAPIADAGASHVIDWIISDRYRGGHPRSYWPGVVTTAITNGSDISSSVRSALVTKFNAIRNGINALTTANVSAVVMGTVRFQSGKQWLTPPHFVAFTSCKYGKGGKLGSQRRRILS